MEILVGTCKIFGHVAGINFLFFKSLPLSDLLNIEIEFSEVRIKIEYSTQKVKAMEK